VEEISRVYFSKTLSVCTVEQDEASVKNLHKSQASGSLTKPEDPPPAKPLTAIQQTALHQASTTLNTLLLLQSHLLLILLTFLPPYLRTLLSHFLPKKYLVTSAPSILHAYAYYLPMMSLNGLLEAFAFSVMSPSDVKTQTRWLFATSICFGISVYILSERLGLGEVGLVYANVVSLGMRAAWAALFSDRWFKRMWARGVVDQKDALEKDEHGSLSSTFSQGISLREILPPLSVLIVFAVSSQIVRYSQARFLLGDQNLLEQSRDRTLLIAQAQHVALGGFFVLLCLGECYRSQRAHIQTLISLVRSRS
jgi:oligosaccharide translocation protein RFT1